jgi:hypothetical protein
MSLYDRVLGESVAAKDEEHVQFIADYIRELVSDKHRWHRQGGRLDDVFDRFAHELPKRRIQSLLKKYPEEIAQRAGVKRLMYTGAEYIASGRGPFGRYGGGRSGEHRKPSVYWDLPGEDV